MKSKKFDKGKLPLDKLIHQFPDSLKAVNETSVYGHTKYIKSDKDWLSFKRLKKAKRRYKSSLVRHLWAYLSPLESNYDAESGLHHLAHLSWNCLALLQIIIENGKTKKL